MTWVVYVLLALNLGLLTWNLQTRIAETATPTFPAPAPAEAKQLPLLTELSADALRPRITAVAPAADGGSPTDPGRSGPAQSELSSSSPARTGRNASRADGTQSSATLASQKSATASATLADSAVTGAPASAVPVLRACLTLGPLAADAPVREIRTWLEQSGARVDVRTDERREVALHWVYFPPRTSRELAVAEVDRLRSEGITDVIAVPKGDMANAISLGVFSRTESRDRRVREMNQRGYQPSVAPRYRVKRASWIDVSAPVDTLPEKAIHARWPDFEVNPRPCGVDSLSAVPAANPVISGAAPDPAIAVGQRDSYNANSPIVRRFFFSGSDAARPSQASQTPR